MRFRSIFISIGLVISVLTTPFSITAADALQLKTAPANWGYIYASGKTTSIQTVERNPPAYIEKKSNFVVNFNTVPATARNAVQAAVDTWAENFASTVPVNVNVNWSKDLGEGILAAAGSKNNYANFTGAPDKTLYYASALANALAGKDLDPANPEIEITITSDAPWYLGIDGKCPPKSYDLQSVILHEMAHGLGFNSGNYYDEISGLGRIIQPTPFDAYAQLPDGRRLIDMPISSLETGKALTSTLMWSGENGIKANNGVKPLLFTPSIYEPGSSVSHLDEKTFSQSGENAVMTPILGPGEVFHLPGSLLLAMFEDLRRKPSDDVSYGLPGSPQNFQAIISDQSAILKFERPANFRSAQIESYLIKNIKTGELTTASTSPVIITGLKNGLDYNFAIVAKNAVGESPSVLSNSVTPEAAWKASVIDSKADGKYLASAIFQGKPVIAYSDGKNGDIKLATYSNNKWTIKTIDGNSAESGKTTNDVSGYISVCTSSVNKKNYLHIFYTDLFNKDLKYALYDGKSWAYEVVDGDGPKVQDYKIFPRVRGGSDVSVSNACAATSNGVQVFYRDESQGILLGAVKNNGVWIYEIVDGDKDTENRTTGDVAFHIKSVTVGNNVHLIYDSAKDIDPDKKVTKGEIRYAVRSGTEAANWKYRTLDSPGGSIAVAGYDVSIFNSTKGINFSWFTSSGVSFPNPNQIRYQPSPTSSFVDNKEVGYGTPNSPIALDEKSILFSCELRLCLLDKSKNKVELISKGATSIGAKSTWINLNKVRYAVAGVSGKLTLYKP
jgi:hypothetical protein